LVKQSPLKEQFFSGEIKSGTKYYNYLTISFKLEEYLRKKVKEISYFPF